MFGWFKQLQKLSSKVAYLEARVENHQLSLNDTPTRYNVKSRFEVLRDRQNREYRLLQSQGERLDQIEETLKAAGWKKLEAKKQRWRPPKMLRGKKDGV